MSTEANKAVLQRFVEEVMNKKNLAAIDELYAASITHTHPTKRSRWLDGD